MPSERRSAGSGGFDFLIPPELSATEAGVFWAPGVDPGTVLLAPLPPDLSLVSVELPDLCPDTAQCDSRGLSLMHGEGPQAIPLLFLDGLDPKDPVAAIVPLGDDGLDRIEAVTRLWYAIHQRTPPPDGRITRQRHARLKRILRAVDGRMGKATYRQIAAAIFGADRVDETPWKSNSLRDAVMALVRDGLGFIAGRYRELLRRRRGR